MASLSDKAGFLIAANLIKYAVGFVMPMVLVRLLSKHDYGTYQQLALLGTLGVAIMVLGLPNSIYYFYDRKDPALNKTLTLQTVAVMICSGALTAAALIFGATMISAFIKNDALAPLLTYYGISVGLLIGSEHFVQFMIAQDRYKVAVVIETAETMLRVAILVLPVLAGYGLMGLVMSLCGYALLRFCFRTVWVLMPLRRIQVRAVPPWFARQQLAYSLPLSLMLLAGLLGAMLDKAIVATVFTPAQYAIYSVGALEIPLDAIFQASVATVLRASMPALIREGHHGQVVRLLHESVRKLAFIVLPSFVFLFGYSYEFITVLFTNEYAESVKVFRIYLFLVPLNMFILSPVPPAYGRTRFNFYVVATVTAIHVCLSFALLHWLGFYGPAISAISTSYLLSCFYFIFARRLTGGTVGSLLPLGTLAKVLTSAAFALLISKFVLGSFAQSLLGLVASGALFAVVWLPSCAAAGGFTEGDRELARRWLRRLTGAKQG